MRRITKVTIVPLRMDCEKPNTVCLECISSDVNLCLITYVNLLGIPLEFVYLIRKNLEIY